MIADLKKEQKVRLIVSTAFIKHGRQITETLKDEINNKIERLIPGHKIERILIDVNTSKMYWTIV